MSVGPHSVPQCKEERDKCIPLETGIKQEVISTRLPLQAFKQGPRIKLLTLWIIVGFTGNS